MKKLRKFKCLECGIEFKEKDFDISIGIEVIVSCPNGCIIGTVYLPDISNIKEIYDSIKR